MVPRVLVVMLDQAGQRALPLWLLPPEAQAVVGTVGLAAEVLDATGGSVRRAGRAARRRAVRRRAAGGRPGPRADGQGGPRGRARARPSLREPDPGRRGGRRPPRPRPGQARLAGGGPRGRRGQGRDPPADQPARRRARRPAAQPALRRGAAPLGPARELPARHERRPLAGTTPAGSTRRAPGSRRGTPSRWGSPTCARGSLPTPTAAGGCGRPPTSRPPTSRARPACTSASSTPPQQRP